MKVLIRHLLPTFGGLALAAVLAATSCPIGYAAPGDGQSTPSAADKSGGSPFTVGAPRSFGNVAVYPLTAPTKAQVDPGPVVTLEEALRSGAAEVREVGSESNGAVGAPPPPAQRHGRHAVARAAGPTVNTLVIQNKGKASVFVLAGTVVKGGNQDREIGQDFLIEPGKTTPVDAFCVEHGRWTGQRAGQVTGGKFGATDLIATTKVRAAAQYKKDQSEVWSEVAVANASHKKSADTGTFMATLDDAQIARERTALAAQIEGALGATTPSTDVVGVAYAIDGKIRGARLFAHHSLERIHRSKLAQSIAMEALTARAEATAPVATLADGSKGGPPPAPRPAPIAGPPPTAAAVETWMTEASSHETEARDTAAANENRYSESTRAYASKAVLKPKMVSNPSPGAAAAPPKPPLVLSTDFVAK